MNIDKKLIRPIVTEKGLSMASGDKYIFAVSMSSTKGSIEQDIKTLFNVEVIDVQTMIMPGKKRKMLKTFRFKTTPKWKKAIVKLKAGQKIDLFPKESK